MAQQGGKGGGARKYGRQKRSPTHAGQKVRTAANKQVRIERQEKLAKRLDIHVSENCLKSRAKRKRLRDFKAMSKADKRDKGDPRFNGEIQFGSRAAVHHLKMHRRERDEASAV
jgi:hypothetical protein